MNKSFQIIAMLVAMLMASPVLALSLDDAKSRGLVGETGSGYLEARSSSREVRSLVASINAQRKTHYSSISARNGTSLDVVEKLAGEKLINRAAKGEYYKDNGGWKQR